MDVTDEPTTAAIGVEPIEIVEYEKRGDGYLYPTGKRLSIDEVRDELASRIEMGRVEYLNVTGAYDMTVSDRRWPSGRIFVAPVEGGSEGHYVHVLVEDDKGLSRTVVLLKTFEGEDHAWEVSRVFAHALGVMWN